MKRQFEILLIEDSHSDALIASESFREAKLKSRLQMVRSREDALDYLRSCGKYEKVQRPDLVLLDLKIKGRDGSEILREIKTDPRLCTIPVIVLTASRAPEDIQKCYRAGANSFISKPIEVYDFLRVLQAIEEYWLDIVSLPSID